MNVKAGKRKCNLINDQDGFTLVEMAVVLVVIGLILGAISIGKDLHRDAEYTRIKQKFIDQWVQSYNSYYERTGVVLGDSQVRPQFMVNGGLYDVTTGAGDSGGNMTARPAPNAICQGAAPPFMARGYTAGTDPNLHDLMDSLGIRMPPGRAEGIEDRYLYLDTNGNPQEIQICFQWNNPQTASNSGNVMVIAGLTPDLARALDQMIDGKPDAREGLFRQEGVVNDTDGAPGVEWSLNNMFLYGSTTNDRNLDEDQVATVIGHYKMNQ